jgi:hypothetical protein
VYKSLIEPNITRQHLIFICSLPLSFTSSSKTLVFSPSQDKDIVMASAEVQQPPAQEPAPALPDYLTDPDSVLKDTDVTWRYGRAPDYSKTRKVFAESA